MLSFPVKYRECLRLLKSRKNHHTVNQRMDAYTRTFSVRTVCVGERDRDTERQTDRQRHRDRDNDGDREKERQTETDRQTETETHRDRDRKRQRQTETARVFATFPACLCCVCERTYASVRV